MTRTNRFGMVRGYSGGGHTALLNRLRRWLAGAAPGVTLVETAQSAVPTESLFGAHGGTEPVDVFAAGGYQPDPTHRYGMWTIERADALSREAIGRFAVGLGERIFRANGEVALDTDPTRRYIFQQVGTRWSLEPGDAWGEAPRVSRLAVIGLAGATSATALHALLEPDAGRRQHG
jgi:G3E family GTPase